MRPETPAMRFLHCNRSREGDRRRSSPIWSAAKAGASTMASVLSGEDRAELSWPVTIAGAGLLPLLIAAAVGTALLRAEGDPISRAHAIRAIAVGAALVAFWRRSAATLGRPRRADVACAGLWAALIAWSVLNAAMAEAPEAAFLHLAAVVSGALLFYASFAVGRWRPFVGLLFLVLLHLVACLYPIYRSGVSAFASSWLTAGGTGAMGLAVLVLGSGSSRGRPSAVRWWGTILALAAAFVGAGVARFPLPPSLVEKGLVAGDARRGDPELARALAREGFCSHPLMGVGAGNLERRLRGFGVFLPGGASGRAGGGGSAFVDRVRTDFFPPGLVAVAQNAIEPTERGPLPDYAAPAGFSGARAFELFAAEMGAAGSGLWIVWALFIVFGSLYALTLAPRSVPSLRALGLLMLWVAVLAQEMAGSALLQPYGLLLPCALAGLAWGACRQEERVAQRQHTRRRVARSPGEKRVRNASLELEARGPVWAEWVPAGFSGWILFFASLGAAGGLLLMTELPRRGARLAERISRSESPAGTQTQLWRRAAAFAPFSSGVRLGLARHLEERCRAEGDRVALGFQAERAFRRAVDLDPYSDQGHAARVAFYLGMGQVERMRDALEAGRRRCPKSLALALWEVRYAAEVRNPERFEAALRDAIRLASDRRYPPDLRPELLDRLAAHREGRAAYREALEAQYESLRQAPANRGALRAIQRLSPEVFGESTKVEERDKEKSPLL